MSSYINSVNYLYGLQKFGIKLGLNNISNLLRHLNNPHECLRTIHITGTNGKGSIAAMLSSILIEAGYKVGLYTSPHLISFKERIRIDGKPISKAEVVRLVEQIREKVDPYKPPTFFEFTTAMAMYYFAQASVDVAILEVGMGGRLDATNVVYPMISIISNVSRDHEAFLGRTLEGIASEKVGIIKNGIEVITAETKPNILRIIKCSCDEKNSTLYQVGKEIRKKKTRDGKFHYFGLDRRFLDLEVGLKGEHQLTNAATALGATEILMRRGFEIPDTAIYHGLRKVYWPGRLEIVQKKPIVVLDGAHNPVAVTALKKALLNEFSFRRLILVLGVMKDKDLRGILKRLIPVSDKVILTKPSYIRAADPNHLYKIAIPYQKDMTISGNVDSAVRLALSYAHHIDLICIAGSLYTVGEAKVVLQRIKKGFEI